MKLIACVLALAFLIQIYGDDVDWSNVKPRHILLDPVTLAYHKQSNQRIVGGFEAQPHSMPTQAWLYMLAGIGNLICSGSLISQRFVLTAAHCVDSGIDSELPVLVLLGAHRVFEYESSQIRVFSEVIIRHPGWNATTLENDIALIELPEKVELNEYIQIMNLPSWSDVGADFVGVTARMSGWGNDADDAILTSSVLRYVFADIISNSVCFDSYADQIKDYHICTDGTGGVGTCIADGGAALVINDKLIGIATARTAPQCEAGLPSVFTRVTNYLAWIGQSTDVIIN